LPAIHRDGRSVRVAVEGHLDRRTFSLAERRQRLRWDADEARALVGFEVAFKVQFGHPGSFSGKSAGIPHVFGRRSVCNPRQGPAQRIYKTEDTMAKTHKW